MRTLLNYLWALAHGYQEKVTSGKLIRIIVGLAGLSYISAAAGQEWVSQIILILCLGSCFVLYYKLGK